MADAEWNRASGVAGARDAYFAAQAGGGGGTGAAQTLLSGQAAAERAYEVAKAQALRNHQVNPDQSAYNTAIQNAETAKKNTLRQLKNAYGQAEAGAIGTRHVALAQAERNYTVTLAAADQTPKSAYATAERNAQVADANAYVTLTTAQAGLDESYWLFEADALATAAANLATANGTPWADYQAAEMSEYETWVHPRRPGRDVERGGLVTAQGAAGIAPWQFPGSDAGRAVRCPQPGSPSKLTVALILRWVDAHYARNNKRPSRDSGPTPKRPARPGWRSTGHSRPAAADYLGARRLRACWTRSDRNGEGPRAEPRLDRAETEAQVSGAARIEPDSPKIRHSCRAVVRFDGRTATSSRGRRADSAGAICGLSAREKSRETYRSGSVPASTSLAGRRKLTSSSRTEQSPSSTPVWSVLAML